MGRHGVTLRANRRLRGPAVAPAGCIGARTKGVTSGVATSIEVFGVVVIYAFVKKRPVKSPRPLCPIRRAAQERAAGALDRSYDFPYCTLAPLTHASLAVPASASHFSIATLYSAARLSLFASLRASACFASAS